MNRVVKSTRIVALILFTAILLSIYAVSLYKLQIVEGKKYAERSQNSINTDETVKAIRGNIYDRYGRMLVTSRNCNNLYIDSGQLFNAEKVEDPNAVILQLVRLVQETGNEWCDELPISMDSPFVYD